MFLFYIQFSTYSGSEFLEKVLDFLGMTFVLYLHLLKSTSALLRDPTCMYMCMLVYACVCTYFFLRTITLHCATAQLMESKNFALFKALILWLIIIDWGTCVYKTGYIHGFETMTSSPWLWPPLIAKQKLWYSVIFHLRDPQKTMWEPLNLLQRLPKDGAGA